MKTPVAIQELVLPLAPFRNAHTCTRCSFMLSQRRNLSSTTPRSAVMGQMQMPKSPSSMLPKEAMQSQQSMLKNAGKSKIPSDIGLLPMTFVPPSLTELFRMYKKDKKKLPKVLWLRLTRNVKGLFTLIYFMKWTSRKNRLTGKTEKTPSLELTHRLEIARKLHVDLYRAIANRDSNAIQKIACAGLYAKAKARIEFRKSEKALPERWFLERYNGILWTRRIPWPISSLLPFRAVKVVAENLVPLPFGGKDAMMRQCVVKIKSRQVLDKGDGNGEKMVDVTEYVVIQRWYAEGIEKKWMIWGTVQPSTKGEIDDLFEMQAMSAGGGLWDRFKSVLPMGGGGPGALL